MNDYEQKVMANTFISPSEWVEVAMRVNQLTQELDNELANLKAKRSTIEAEYVKKDFPVSKAEVMARGDMDYETYLQKKGLRARINKFLTLANTRANIRNI